MEYFCTVNFKRLVNKEMKNVKSTMAGFCNCCVFKKTTFFPKLYSKIYK